MTTPTRQQSPHRHLTPIVDTDRRLATGTGIEGCLVPLARRSLRIGADGTIGRGLSCDHLLAA